MPWNTTRIVADVRKTGQQQIEREAEKILNSSKAIVPLNKDRPRMDWHRGTLQRSGKVESLSDRFGSELGDLGSAGMAASGDVVGAVISYSVDEPYDYARLQHDNKEFSHDSPGQALYLKEPFDQQKGEAIRNVEAAIKSSLRRMP